MHVVAYARVWEDDLEQDPEAQFKLIREWAEKNNVIIEQEFADRSDGTDPNAENLQKMTGYVCEHKEVSRVVIVEPGRLCRAFTNLSMFTYNIKKMGCNIMMLIFPHHIESNAEYYFNFILGVVQSDKEYTIYKLYGAKPVLGQITFADYLEISLCFNMEE